MNTRDLYSFYYRGYEVKEAGALSMLGKSLLQFGGRGARFKAFLPKFLGGGGLNTYAGKRQFIQQMKGLSMQNPQQLAQNRWFQTASKNMANSVNSQYKNLLLERQALRRGPKAYYGTSQAGLANNYNARVDAFNKGLNGQLADARTATLNHNLSTGNIQKAAMNSRGVAPQAAGWGAQVAGSANNPSMWARVKGAAIPAAAGVGMGYMSRGDSDTERQEMLRNQQEQQRYMRDSIISGMGHNMNMGYNTGY